MGRKKKYTPAAARRAVNDYLSSIRRTVTVTEKIDSGRKDERGHVVWETIPVINDRGEEMKRTEFLVPPTVGGICAALGIHRSTWADWGNDPEYAGLVEETREVLRTWREEELLTRRDVRGLIFDLQNNYDYKDRKEIELGQQARRTMAAVSMTIEEREEILREIVRDFGAGGEDDEPTAG